MKATLLTFVILGIILGNVECGKGQAGYQLHARFADTRQLKVGDPVTMAGVQIGKVESIAGDRFGPASMVTLEIKGTAEVKIDAIASISSDASSGQSSVILTGGSTGAAAAVHGTNLKTDQTSSAK